MQFRSWSLFAALPFAGVLALLAHGCGSSSSEVVEGPRRNVLIQVTDVVILPTYRSLAARTRVLADTAAALRAGANVDTLGATQEAWREARQTWKQSEAFRLGPTEDLRLRIRTKLDWSPTNPNLIEQEVLGTAVFTPEYVDSLGVSRRGFLALEYLLFDPEGGDDAILAKLTGPDGPRRLDFIAALADDTVVQSDRLVDAWDPAFDDYRSQLVEAGRTSTVFPELKKAIDEVVSAVVQLAVTIEEKKLGGPAGLPAGSPKPNDVEAWRSNSSAADILDNIQGIENVYRGEYDGAEGAGLQSLVLRGAPDIDFHVIDAIRRARRAVAAIPGPLRQAVIDSPDAVEDAFDAVHEMKLTLTVDLVAALGATPRFTSDGD